MNKPTHLEQSRVFPMQKGDTDNPFINKQKESASLELEIKATGKGNNANKGVANLGISEEEEVAKEAMEVQVEYSEVTTSVLENINIPIERIEESILAIQVNTNEEKIEEEVVNIGEKQPEKEIEKNRTIYIEMEEKEIINKPSQVGKS